MKRFSGHVMQNDFISFFDARKFLTKKFGKMPSDAEFWMWCFLGTDGGGIDAYHKSIGDCPNNKYEKYKMLSGHLVMFRDIKAVAKGMKHFWYLRSEIESFEPIDRFITADELIKKWTVTLYSEEEAKEYIKSFAREAPNWGDNNPILKNYFFGAFSSTTKAFEPLNGVYLENDILAVERHCNMREPQAEILKERQKGYSIPAELEIIDSIPKHETVGDDGAVAATEQRKTERRQGERRTHAPSQLHIFFWRVHQSFSKARRPTAQEVWNEIQFRHSKHDTDEIIQEVTANKILWCSGYGNEQTFARSSFDKTLSTIRRNPPF